MVWGNEAKSLSGTALWTETAEPLPRPPLSEFSNNVAVGTITQYPHLFAVSTPINVDRFENLLTIAQHPNLPFIRSVCLGLWEVPSPSPKTEAEWNFIRGQIGKEEAHDLLPGMYSMPIHAVPKEGGKFRLVTNHSAGEYSLNSMIAKEDIAGVTLDNVQDLGEAINKYQRHHPLDFLQIWKADVLEAYLDCANVFGGRASQRISHAFMSLVIWIAVFIRLIQAFIYVDDSFSFAKLRDMSYYVKYRKMLPSEMVTLLLLWDELGIPHEERKQIFGSPLPIIGFDVDPNLMKISLKDDSKAALIRELQEFARYKSKRSLRDFEHITGSLNWALNVCPLLRPGLSAVYAKIKGKSNSKGMLWLNRAVVEELVWAAYHLERSNGIFLLKSVSWCYNPLPLNTLEVYCDASGSGMGFWYPSLNLAFQSGLPERPPITDIFFTEVLCVASAIHDAVTWLPRDGQLAVFTDSLNTVFMFNSLSGGPGFNQLLMDVVETIMVFKVDFRVFHISGCDNIIADRLSHWRGRDAVLCSPGLQVTPFEPPRFALGGGKK
ncbi:hypothetical protein BDR05DRAFT_977435 [Suillus weaverae]|nr:hypothetical protein BDR05DRAFT_977435 [Suillus weaverae]